MPRRSPIFRNSSPSVCASCAEPFLGCVCHAPGVQEELLDLEWSDVDESGIKVPNPAPPVRPVTLALDLIEVQHQAGAMSGRTRISPEAWSAIFYRGDASSASKKAKERAFERWKSAVRAFGFECPTVERGDERGGFCVNMSRAIPWAERVLEESARRAEERRQRKSSVASTTKVANKGALVRIRR